MSMKGKFVYKGGPGSGHHGHAGRPGKHGGSAPGGGKGKGSSGSPDKDAGKKFKPLSDSEKKKYRKLLPGGKARKGDDRYSARGGYRGQKAIEKTVAKAKAMGFKQVGTSAISSQFGAMGGGEHYQHPDSGVVLSTSESYGVTKRYNRYSMSLHYPEE